MRVINQSSKTALSGGDPVDFLTALIVREISNLSRRPELTSKEIISLERLSSMLCRLRADQREETMLLVKLGVKGSNVSEKVLKDIEKLLLESSGNS